MSALTKCICCESLLLPLIDFGSQPLANTYQIKEKYPLAVNRCVSCCHLQLNEFVDPKILYPDYAYCSGTGATAHEHFANFAKLSLGYFKQARTVLDIASNDGSQLDAFQKLGLETHGIDPAQNLNGKAAMKRHQIRTGFFEEFKYWGDKTFDIITAQNVLAHTPTPFEFLQRCTEIMHDQSKLLIATSQANLVVNGECDAIYHEHISYFNAHSMIRLAERANLTVLDILMPDIHGTSFIFVLGKTGKASQRVSDRLEWEFLVGMMAPPLYRWWKAHVEAKRERINHLIRDYSRQGYYSVGLGAAAKGISMLNMADSKLDLLADSTPSKWGQITSGMQIAPFASIATLKHEKILFVILAWNVLFEIKANCLKLRDNPNDVFVELR